MFMTQVSIYLLSLLELIWSCVIISVTPKLIKKVIINLFKEVWPWLFSSGGSEETVLQPSYILVELFNICLKESCFPQCWKVLFVLPVFQNWKTIVLLAFFLWLVESLKNFWVINLLIILIMWPFFSFSVIFRSYFSTADLLTVKFDIVGRAFNWSGGTRALVLNIYPRLFTEFIMLVFFTDLSLLEFQIEYLALFRLFSVKDDFEWFWIESLRRNI